MNLLKNTTFVAVVSLATLVLLAYVVFGKKSETNLKHQETGGEKK